MFMDILLSHYMLICGSNRHFIKISNLFIFKFKGEGLIYYMPFIFIICVNKQNQHDCFKIIKILCNKKPLICIFNGLAFYLLYYWNINDEPFLNFNRQSVWYNICLIKSSIKDHKAAFS